MKSIWALILFGGGGHRHHVAELTFCGPESAGQEHLCAVLLKHLWEVRKLQAPLSFGQDYLLQKLLVDTPDQINCSSRPLFPPGDGEAWLLRCQFWGRSCCEPPVTWWGIACGELGSHKISQGVGELQESWQDNLLYGNQAEMFQR